MERRLRITDKPATTALNVLRQRRPAMRLFGRQMRTYYLCGACGIIVGRTPAITMKRGVVLECRNCGGGNEL